jgi:hypothetical protein
MSEKIFLKNHNENRSHSAKTIKIKANGIKYLRAKLINLFHNHERISEILR